MISASAPAIQSCQANMNSQNENVPPTMPPSSPSTVLFGEISGASGRRPHERPAK